MNNSKDVSRNEAAEKGQNHDPALRDDSAIQPGVQTISGGRKDDANEHLTRTTTDSKDGDKNADLRFDEVDGD
ncbi:MAG: hypothetical protein ACXWB9_04040 [Flavisolibacter sp.]